MGDVYGAPLARVESNFMTKSYWLMKSEPDVYSWDDLVAGIYGIFLIGFFTTGVCRT